MNLVMCCTPLGKEDVFQSELRFSVIASVFFKKFYPNGKVHVLTTADAFIPKEYESLFLPVRYDFGKYPFAIARQLAYKAYLESDLFTDGTFFTGCDVVFCSPGGAIADSKGLAMTYRYHLTQPYCSDLFYVPASCKAEAIDFLSKVIDRMFWMPIETQSGWADQICQAIEIGHLKDSDFDGSMNSSERVNNFNLFPGDEYLYTPNDYFSSIKSDDAGHQIKDCLNSQDMLALLKVKHVFHFKGGRKDLFFIFAKLCEITGFINIDYDRIGIEKDKLFALA